MATQSPSKARSAASTASPSPSVVVCDDHIAIRAGLRQIFETEQVRVVGECQSLDELLVLARQHPEAVLVTDLGIDGVPFSALVKEVRLCLDDMPIVVYSMRETPATIDLCYKSGAVAFVPKRADVAELIKAVRSASVGKLYFPSDVATELAALHVDRRHPKLLLLPRELEIFEAYAKNPAVAEIAASLGVTPKRVQNTLSQIAQKLDLPRSQFRSAAIRHGIVEEV